MDTYADSPDVWRARAEEVRAQANNLGDEKSREILLSIAKSYERMAKRAAERIRRDRVTQFTNR
jgi:hypothetical protein